MRLGEEIRRQRNRQGYSLRDMEPLTGYRYVTINEIELSKGKNGPLLNTVKQIARGAKFDIHKIAHAAFDLDEPEQLGELSGTLKILCDIAFAMGEQQRKELLDYADYLFQKGGDAITKPLDTKAGHG